MTKIKEVIRLHIQSYDNRMRIIQSLADSGYSCWVEEEKIKHKISSYNYYVCFDLKQHKPKED